MKVKLTKKFVDTVAYEDKGHKDYLDTELVGFILRVGKTTKKYRLYKRINGKLHKDLVEDASLITVSEARDKARIMIANITKGVDIYDGLHAKDTAEDDSVPTLRQAYNYFKSMKPHLKANTVKTYDTQILSNLDEWLDVPLNDISKTMVSDKHRKLSRRSKAQANATMRTLRSVWNYCRVSFLDSNEDFIIKEQPVSILNAKKDWNKVKPKTRHVEDEYIGHYFTTLIGFNDRSSFKQAPHSNNTRDILLMFMFIGVRTMEAQTLRWKDVDLKAGRITFKDTKNGADHIVPVGDILWAILKERKRLNEGQEWVFPTSLAKLDTHVKELSAGYRAVSAKADIYITPHDLRRTFGTVANSLNISYPVLKQLLNHREIKASDDVTLQYVQVSQRQLRDALNQIEQFYCKKINSTQDRVIEKLLANSSAHIR